MSCDCTTIAKCPLSQTFLIPFVSRHLHVARRPSSSLFLVATATSHPPKVLNSSAVHTAQTHPNFVVGSRVRNLSTYGDSAPLFWGQLGRTGLRPLLCKSQPLSSPCGMETGSVVISTVSSTALLPLLLLASFCPAPRGALRTSPFVVGCGVPSLLLQNSAFPPVCEHSDG